MEKTLQKMKLEFQQLKISQPKTPPRKGMIEFPAFNAPKKKPAPRLRCIGGCRQLVRSTGACLYAATVYPRRGGHRCSDQETS